MSLPVLRGTAALAELIDPAVDLALVADGFAFTEGPAWSPAGQDLVFSDIPGDTRYRWSEADGLSVDLRPTFKGNGMFYERDETPEVCANLAWGGPDLRTLFLCTSTSLRAVPTLVGPAVRRDGF
jgi:sugar lactone lactonase YvrE